MLQSAFAFSQSAENTALIDSLATASEQIEQELVKVSEKLYIIQPYGVAGNTGVYIGEQGVILVDDQWSLLADRIKELVGSITDQVIKVIINTHYHFDHTHGNLAFGKENIQIISQENALERMSERQVMPTFFNAVQEPYPIYARPNMSFEKKFVLHLEDEKIELIHLPNAHTDGDIIVYFQKANVYHTGDIFTNGGLPHIDEAAGGSIYGVIEAVDYLLQNADEDTKFIPGHGPIGTKKELQKYMDHLTALLTLVETSTKEGMDIEAIIKEIKLSIDFSHFSGDNFIRQIHRSVLKKIKE